MHNEEFDDLALLFVSGELSPAERERFEAHRPGCAACAELLSALEAGSRCAEAAAVSLPLGRAEFLAEKLAGGSSEPDSFDAPQWVGDRLKRLLGAAVAVGACAVAIFISTSMAPGVGPEPLWSQEITQDIADLRSDLEDLETAIEIEAAGAEIDFGFSALEEASARLDRELPEMRE